MKFNPFGVAVLLWVSLRSVAQIKFEGCPKASQNASIKGLNPVLTPFSPRVDRLNIYSILPDRCQDEYGRCSTKAIVNNWVDFACVPKHLSLVGFAGGELVLAGTVIYPVGRFPQNPVIEVRLSLNG